MTPFLVWHYWVGLGRTPRFGSTASGVPPTRMQLMLLCHAIPLLIPGPAPPSGHRQRLKALRHDDLIKACSRSAQSDWRGSRLQLHNRHTLSVAVMSAPLPTSISTIAVWPLPHAQCRHVMPSCGRSSHQSVHARSHPHTAHRHPIMRRCTAAPDAHHRPDTPRSPSHARAPAASHPRRLPHPRRVERHKQLHVFGQPANGGTRLVTRCRVTRERQPASRCSRSVRGRRHPARFRMFVSARLRRRTCEPPSPSAALVRVLKRQSRAALSL